MRQAIMNIRQKIYAGALSDKNCSVNTGRPISETASFFLSIILVAVACTGPRATSQVVSTLDANKGVTVSTKKSEAALAYEKECQAELAKAKEAFSTLEKYDGDKSIATVLDPLDEIWTIIDKTLNTAQLLRNVHPDDTLREVADICEQDFSKIVTDIGLSRPLYDAVLAVDVSGEDAVTRRYVKHLLRDFKRAGVDRDHETRDKIRKLREELVTIGQSFGQNIREDVRSIKLDSVDELAGLPQDYIDAHKPGEDGKITITTDYPDILPFIAYAKNDARRLEIYKVYRKRGHPKNFEILQSLLNKRHELATLLSYKNWAHYITEDKMIKTAKAAREFIDKIATISKNRAERDYQELLTRLQKDYPDAKEVGDWQKAYIEEIVKKERYNFDSQVVRRYFSFDKVKKGVLATTSKMFGLEYKKINIPVWHESVEAFEVVDGNKVIGRFYLDMHPRENKYKHAASFTLQSGIKDRQLPEGTLVCNFPSDGLMEHSQVVTFFHEFGHLLHHLLSGDQRWIGNSAFSAEWDFIEVPSQMLEEWAWDANILRSFATDESGEPIPEDLVAAMRKARDFGKGIWIRHQMFYAAVSLNYYDRDPREFDTTALTKELQASYSPFSYVDDTYFQLSFGHLNGYSAIYYTYMWSLVIAKDIFSVFKKKGLQNSNVVNRYRASILAPGGSRDAALMVHDFLGRDYNFDAFAAWINAE